MTAPLHTGPARRWAQRLGSFLLRWLKGGAWRSRRDDIAVRRHAIPDDLWKRTLVRYPFLQRRDPEAAAALRRLTSLFLNRKEFTAAGGLRLTDAMVVAIAAQAVLPVLRLGLARYDGFVGIVVHADQVVARRATTDEDGVVHEYDEVLAGEAMEGGPVMLSWRDVRGGAASAGGAGGPARAYNVVIHEFAHVLDMEDGSADGVPRLPPDLPDFEWRSVLASAHARLVQQIEAGETGVLDPYAAQGQEEFFAVASESFFITPASLQREYPRLYALFARFYRQDPSAETAPARRR